MPAKPHYNPQAARARREARQARQHALVENARAMGALEEIERQASAHAEELLQSPNLKVWRYQRTPRSMAHLFVELSDGTSWALCGKRIDERVVAVVVTTNRKGDCAKCNRAAEAIFGRRASPPTSQGSSH